MASAEAEGCTERVPLLLELPVGEELRENDTEPEKMEVPEKQPESLGCTVLLPETELEGVELAERDETREAEGRPLQDVDAVELPQKLGLTLLEDVTDAEAVVRREALALLHRVA